eukprot:TRINITY_DN15154_c0_g1_i2.p1 TRINITY_DN15154_c0_g1~~TRINITY_DN15154_c0_g1_i2.p1  ORF type:complete len:702 (+),score=121.46 TRINITY_DN15154_c0_g1_i2:193-2298(+)
MSHPDATTPTRVQSELDVLALREHTDAIQSDRPNSKSELQNEDRIVPRRPVKNRLQVPETGQLQRRHTTNQAASGEYQLAKLEGTPGGRSSRNTYQSQLLATRPWLQALMPQSQSLKSVEPPASDRNGMIRTSSLVTTISQGSNLRSLPSVASRRSNLSEIESKETLPAGCPAVGHLAFARLALRRSLSLTRHRDDEHNLTEQPADEEIAPLQPQLPPDVVLPYDPMWPEVLVTAFEQAGINSGHVIEGFSKAGMPLMVKWQDGRPVVQNNPSMKTFPLTFQVVANAWSAEDEAKLRADLAADDRCKMGASELPKAIKALDFWQAQSLFHLYDRKNLGELDSQNFFELLQAACRGVEEVGRERARNMFREIDLDSSGKIDKEEFLGWVFETVNNFLNCVRDKLQAMQSSKLKALFRKIDSDFNGQIDRDELWSFIAQYSTIPISRKACDELHEFIDADGSGGIDIDEFLNWINPGRELRKLLGDADVDGEVKQKTADDYKTLSSDLKESLPTSFVDVNTEQFSAPKKPLMESRPGKPVVLKFTIGNGFRGIIKKVIKKLRSFFGHEQVLFDIFVDDNCFHNSCERLEAQVGRGILLWSRDHHLPHQDDPFEDADAAVNYCADVLSKCLPDVINAANLRMVKRKGQNVCYNCSKKLDGLKVWLVASEYKTCGRKCFAYVNAVVKAKKAEKEARGAASASHSS